MEKFREKCVGPETGPMELTYMGVGDDVERHIQVKIVLNRFSRSSVLFSKLKTRLQVRKRFQMQFELFCFEFGRFESN